MMNDFYLIEILLPLTYLVAITYMTIFIYMIIRKEKRRNQLEEKRRYTYDICIDMQKKAAREDKLERLFIYDKIAAGVNRDVLDEEVVRTFYESDFMQEYKKGVFDMAMYRNSSKNSLYFKELELLLQKWK